MEDVSVEFEDIGIDPNKPATPPIHDLDIQLPSQKPNPAWHTEYKKLMNRSVLEAHSLLARRSWNLLTESEHLNLYECDSSNTSFYVLRAAGILPVRPERLFYVLKDYDVKTRSAWESRVVQFSVVESFETTEGPIRVVQSEVQMGIPLVANRYFIGIDWSSYDAKTRSWKYVFRTTQHRLTRCPDDKVNVIALIACTVRQLEHRNQAELNMIVHINPGNSLPSAIANSCKVWLLERVRLYEQVAANWKQFYGVK